MSTLTIDDIATCAGLSRLAINEELASSYTDDLSKILSMMDILSDVDTDGVAPLTNVHDMTQRLRDDVVSREIDRELNQSVAPNVAEGLFLVPQVIE